MRRSSTRPEQIVYARILDIGTKIGLGVLVATFALYLIGVPAPYIADELLPSYWNLPAGEFVERVGMGRGWDWVAYLGAGDMMNYVGIAILSGTTVICYLPIMVMFWMKRERAYALICACEVCVILLAASGLLRLNGH